MAVGSAVSAPVVFDRQSQSAYVVTLSGAVMALWCTLPAAAAADGDPSSPLQPHGRLQINSRWRYAGPAAIFAAPAIARASLVCAAVDGSVFALDMQTGKLSASCYDHLSAVNLAAACV